MAESTTQLSEFRRWVQVQKPILNSLDTDEFLLRFLRVTGFNLTEAKEHLIRFWKYRSENPQWFATYLFLPHHSIFSRLGLQTGI